MESDDIYKYLGLLLVVVFVVYIVIKTMNFQMKVLEGFGLKDVSNATGVSTDKDKVPEVIKNNTNKAGDALLIDKYLKAYEDTIIDLDANIDMYILSQVLENAETISADPGSIESQSIITKINAAKSFNESLNHAIKVLDKK